ncbi:MAG: hypothetical protein AAF542_13725 [Pseudomonadota bacterium]
MSATGLCNRELAYAKELRALGDSPALRSAVRLQLVSALRFFWQEIASSHGLVRSSGFDNLAELRTALHSKLGEDHPIAELYEMEESQLVKQLLYSCDPASALQKIPDISHKKTEINIIKASQDTEFTELNDADFELKVLDFLQRVVTEWREYSQEY